MFAFTGATVNEDNVSDDLVPYGLGSKCGWLPSDHVQWAFVQPYPFKDQETKLDLKLQLAVKESAALKPEDLDKLRTEQLQYWTLRALQLEEERAKMGYRSSAAGPTHAGICSSTARS